MYDKIILNQESTEENSGGEPPGLEIINKNKRVSKEMEKFYKRFFVGSTQGDWLDWKWQLVNSINDLKDLTKYFQISSEEMEILGKNAGNLPLRITPYYLGNIYNKNSKELLKTVIPSSEELNTCSSEEIDPLGEDNSSPVDCLVHRYPDRVLLLSTSSCATYCRYCTRSRSVGKSCLETTNIEKINKAIEYIKTKKEIRDVIISGGDPLMLSDDILEYILASLREIEHIEIIRIGTKIPAVMPQRINTKLVNMLKKYHPLWMSVHFTHPDEITLETSKALEKLANAGIPLGSQTVLLKDINDNVECMKKLMHKLVLNRVRPYYLYQCDAIKGSSHFRTDVSKGIEIIKGLRGFTSGYAVPHYVIDAPGGGGKIPLLPNYYQGEDEEKISLKNYEDKIYYYHKISERE